MTKGSEQMPEQTGLPQSQPNAQMRVWSEPKPGH
jgi:hypothetical protein